MAKVFNYKKFKKELDLYNKDPFAWSEREANRRKTIKQRLAEKIEILYGKGSHCDPKRLVSNHGYNNAKWDCANWTGYVTLPDGVTVGICSWRSMTSLVNDKEPLKILNDYTNEII